MSVLKNLKPEKVFYYFEEICRIPHGSHHTRAISDYCVRFAEERNLEVLQDELGNVIIRKEGSAGYEKADRVILQGHLDMVCEKTAGSAHDFEKDGLELMVCGDYLSAKETTLGGDDGIAIAMILSVLDSSCISHPPIEAVFTTDEEVGMIGAAGLNPDVLTGRMLINIDSEEEGILTAGCAGGFRFDAEIPVEYEEADGCAISVRISGLQGGHSGMEIHRQRGNAIALAGRLLNHCREMFPIRIAGMEGGSKDNVIAKEARLKLIVPRDREEAFVREAEELERIWRSEFGGDEPDLFVQISRDEEGAAFSEESTNRVIFYLTAMPDGVVCYERQIPGQVETSLNAGILKTGDRKVTVSHLVRSSVESKKEELKERILAIVRMAGGQGTARDEYPSWSYREESRLRDIMIRTYRDMYGKEPEVMTVHAGLECGLFVGRIPDLDCVSFGPELLDVHSVNERMNIRSVERCYNYLLEVLKAVKPLI